MTNAYFNHKEAMEYMGIKSKTTFIKYIKQGLPVIKVGNSKRISKTAIDEFMKAHQVTIKK